MSSEQHLKAKEYQKTRNWLVLISIGLTLLLLGAMIVFNFQNYLFTLSSRSASRFMAVLSYFFLFSSYFLIFQLPLSVYSGYFLERKYNLSNQSFLAWSREAAKKEILSFGIAFLMVWGLFEVVWSAPDSWWFWVWVIYAIVSYGMGKLFPVLIVPLFYKYTPLQDGELKDRIMRLAKRFGMNVENIYSLNLSKTTKKANAAFLGIGRTKRVVLGDTLISNFTIDEIEMVLAHELGHFKNHDIWKQLAFGLASSLITFFISFKLLQAKGFGGNGLEDLLFLPHLCFIGYCVGLFIGPLGNGYSRMVERAADLFALRAIPEKDVFVSTMRKLSEINLSDPNPHPVIEFLLYDHPSISKRIQFAQTLQ